MAVGVAVAVVVGVVAGVAVAVVVGVGVAAVVGVLVVVVVVVVVGVGVGVAVVVVVGAGVVPMKTSAANVKQLYVADVWDGYDSGGYLDSEAFAAFCERITAAVGRWVNKAPKQRVAGPTMAELKRYDAGLDHRWLADGIERLLGEGVLRETRRGELSRFTLQVKPVQEVRRFNNGLLKASDKSYPVQESFPEAK